MQTKPCMCRSMLKPLPPSTCLCSSLFYFLYLSLHSGSWYLIQVLLCITPVSIFFFSELFNIISWVDILSLTSITAAAIIVFSYLCPDTQSNSPDFMHRQSFYKSLPRWRVLWGGPSNVFLLWATSCTDVYNHFSALLCFEIKHTSMMSREQDRVVPESKQQS